MYWGRVGVLHLLLKERNFFLLLFFFLFINICFFPVVSAVYACLVVLIALISVGSFLINSNTVVKDSWSSLAFFSFFSFFFVQVNAGGQLAAGVLLTVGIFTFPPAILAFNFVSDAPCQDDSLVPAPVLIHLRVMMGFQVCYWIIKLAATFIVGLHNAMGGLSIFEVILVIAALLLALVLTFVAFKRHPPSPQRRRSSNNMIVSKAKCLFNSLVLLILFRLSRCV
jgi:hypothetical protein